MLREHHVGPEEVVPPKVWCRSSLNSLVREPIRVWKGVSNRLPMLGGVAL